MNIEEFRDYIDFLRSQDEISYDVYSGLIDGIDTLEQEPCEDCISRQAVLDIDFHKLIHTVAKPAEMIKQKIEQLPPVTPQPKTGYWIQVDSMADAFDCSECDAMVSRKCNYCPKCGIRMVEPQESEDKE